MALSYLEWNDVLIKHYFNEEMAGKDIIVFSDQETIDNIASQYGEKYEDFKKKAIEGPPWAQDINICKLAVKAYEDWRMRGLKYPPYFGYLVLFVSAATIKWDFDAKAYYPKLRQILGEPEESGPYPYFDKVDGLWDDLEKWSIDDMHESLGRFKKRVRGKWKHVGIPYSQVIFSNSERNLLSQFFSECGLDPADPPSDNVIIRQLVIWGRNRLHGRTLKLLNLNDDSLSDLRQALAELVTNDLCNWDGVSPESESPTVKASSISRKQTLTGAHICLEVDELVGTVKSSIRIKANRAFPDDDLTFDLSGKILTCHSSVVPGWSTRLVSAVDNKKISFDPSILDWSDGYTFADKEHDWSSRLRGSKLRIFLPGATQDLTDWVELQKIQTKTKYYICCCEEISNDIEEWGIRSNESFHRLSLTGLPAGWSFFSADNITASCPGVDALTLSKKSTLHVRGGIQIGRTNRYLNIAPPRIIVDNGSDGAVVTIDGVTVQPVEGIDTEYELTSTKQLDTPISIELKTSDGAVIQRTVIYITSIDSPVTSARPIIRDKFGQVMHLSMGESPIDRDQITGICGALPQGSRHLNEIYSDKVLPTYLSRRIIFIGKFAGQVVDWPKEKLPTEWEPTWAIAKTKLGRDKWQVYYCGNSDDESPIPIRKTNTINRSDIKHWKKAIWTMRNRTSPPKFDKYDSLWKEYLKCASNV